MPGLNWCRFYHFISENDIVSYSVPIGTSTILTILSWCMP